MLELDTRQAILRLAAKGHGPRAIAKALNLSRNSVRRVLRDGQARVFAGGAAGKRGYRPHSVLNRHSLTWSASSTCMSAAGAIWYGCTRSSRHGAYTSATPR